MAKAFTAYDRFFCSLLSSTYPNREYMHAGQSYGMMDNTVPIAPSGQLGFPDTTIFRALSAKGVSNRYYYSDIPVSALWGAPGISRSSPVQTYYEQAATGTLPALSFVDPAFNGEDQGTSGDEHPHGDVRVGQAFIADVVHAFLESPQFKRGALFIVYDEWGGFFDHVAPPRVPDLRASSNLNKDFGQMGLRIPAVVVSPYARRGYVDHYDLRVRVDPEDDPLPLRDRAADAARPVREQHRRVVRLGVQARLRRCRRCRPRRTSWPRRAAARARSAACRCRCRRRPRRPCPWPRATSGGHSSRRSAPSRTTSPT